MRAFTSIPDDHCAARDQSGRYLMVDLKRRPTRGKVWAKAFGACPEMTTAAEAARNGMRILGGVVGIYRASYL